MRRRRFITATGGFAFAACLSAEESSEIERIRAKYQFPALARAAMQNGKLIINEVCGVRVAGGTDLAGADDRWHFGSITKSMTSTLAALLVAEGKIRWESSPAEVLAKAVPKVDPKWKDVRLEHLLVHRGGAPGEPPGAIWGRAWDRAREGKLSHAEQTRLFAADLLAEPPVRPPGTDEEYSNQGYIIAGQMLATAAGMPWEELLQRRIFTPLGMRSCGFGAPPLPSPQAHAGKPESWRTFSPRQVEADNPPGLGPAGTVHGSLADLLRYASWHAAPALFPALKLPAELFAKLHTPWPGGSYAMGWSVLERPWARGTVYSHSGSNTMWYANLWVAPAIGAAFVAVTNCAPKNAHQGTDSALWSMIQKVAADPK